jgi:hypothetical protein
MIANAVQHVPAVVAAVYLHRPASQTTFFITVSIILVASEEVYVMVLSRSWSRAKIATMIERFCGYSSLSIITVIEQRPNPA